MGCSLGSCGRERREETTADFIMRTYRDALLGKPAASTSNEIDDEAIVRAMPLTANLTAARAANEISSVEYFGPRIKYIIDIEGFRVGSRFMIKELGVLDMDDRMVWSKHFAVGDFSKLDECARRQVVYLTNNVHGLRYEDEPGDESQDAIYEHVRVLASRAASTDRLVAYKGGHYELDVLRKVGYERCAFNLEHLGCPRFELLANARPEWLSDAKRFECERHTSPRGVLPPRDSERRLGIHKRVLHCPRVELWCFMRWLEYEEMSNR